jgi:hypothetical protein
LPSLSTGLVMLSVASMEAMSSHTVESTRSAPGQRLTDHKPWRSQWGEGTQHHEPTTEAEDIGPRIPSAFGFLVDRNHEPLRAEDMRLRIE